MIKKVKYKYGFPTITPEDINEYGTRFKTPNVSKKIITCLGCSHTYGFTGDHNCWPHLLEGDIKNDRYQVLNMGRRNYSLKLIIDWYDFFVKDYKPCICIIQVPNFTRQPHPTLQEDKNIHYTAKYGILDIHLKQKLISDQDLIDISDDLISREVEKLDAFIEKLKLQEVVPVVFLYRTYDYLPSLTYKMIDRCHRRIQKMCNKNGSILCQSSKISKDKFIKKKWMHTDNAHPNTKGNKKIAQFIHSNIKHLL